MQMQSLNEKYKTFGSYTGIWIVFGPKAWVPNSYFTLLTRRDVEVNSTWCQLTRSWEQRDKQVIALQEEAC